MQNCGVNYAATTVASFVVREAEAGIAMTDGVFERVVQHGGGYRQLVVQGILDGAIGLMAAADECGYAAIATPVTSAQMLKA
jgi:hypothetical protein